ncbi:MAG: PAS domain-containing protein [Actinobacteria bacterium]|nr:PAS domain-containing protein [Actinomycetota bacterium]
MARPPAGHGDGIQATFDRMVTRGVAAGSPSTGVLVAVIGLRFSSHAMVGLGLAAVGVGAWAMWQVRADRPNAGVLIAATVLSMGLASLIVPDAATPALAAAVVLFSLTGILSIRLGQTGWYTALTLLAFLARPAQLLITRTGTEADVMAYAILSGILAFGYGALAQVGREIRRTEGRDRFLFEHAPVALWDNDLTGVARWMQALRVQGVEDLRAHLALHPEALDEGIRAISTRRANRAVAALLGADDPSTLIGPIPPSLINDRTRTLFADQFAAMWDGRTVGEVEYSGPGHDGASFRAVFTWAMPGIGDGGSTRVITAISDITALHVAETERESTAMMQRALLQAVPDLLFICDADGTYLNYHVPDRSPSPNTARREDLYVPPAHFLGRRPGDVLPAELAQQMMITIATALETGAVQQFEYELPVGGESRHWEMRVSPIEGEARVLTLVRDITESMKARIELQRLVKSKDDFIAAVSHEIRTPLTGIVGFAHLLSGDQGDLDPDERRAMVESLADQSSDLTNIVEDLLVAAKADLGRLTVAEVSIDLRAQVAQVVEAWDPGRLYQPEIRGGSVRCVGDPHRVRQVIRNLLTNARRYGGDRIRIEISGGPSTGQIVVADNGPGIPEEQIEEAFLPYHRAAPRDGLTAALGIGLPISRTLARRMGGDLVYERSDGETRFRLSLPLSRATVPLERSGAAGSAAAVLGRHAIR